MKKDKATAKDKNQVWQEILKNIRVSVSPAIFSTWLSQTHLISLKKLDKKRYLAEIGCSTPYVKATIETRYFGLIQDSLIAALDSHTDLMFTVKDTPAKNTSQEIMPLFEEKDKSEEFINNLKRANVRVGFNFENFAVSGSNQMAHAAAEAVSNDLGKAYNPLFLWGGVGVGKTHLMHAVGASIINRDLNAKVLACTGEDFTNDIVEGIRSKTTQKFREKYRKLDALLIDDIQFIAGKDKVQEEFFHSFNAVTAAGGQIILTSDKPPFHISKLEERLQSRFEAGLIVDISKPDFELRCAIVQIKSQEKGVELTVQHVHLIAGNIEHARELEGFLVQLTSEVKFKKAEISEEMIKGLISKKGGVKEVEIAKNKTPEDMIVAVCSHFSIRRRVMLGKGRTKTVARSRQILMYLLRIDLGLPLEEVGRIVGGRDHTTIMHGVDKITQLSSTDNQIREDIVRIKGTL